jgi:hypothetical protein
LSRVEAFAFLESKPLLLRARTKMKL